MIRVLLVDDQTLVRQGIAGLLGLSQAVCVVGEASDGEQALDRVAELSPDVVLLDLRMPKLDGLGVLRALGERGDLPPTLVLTTFDDPEQVMAAIQSGARGYLLKDVSLETLEAGILTVHAGGTLIQPAITARLLDGLQQLRPPEDARRPVESLSDKEIEVLRLIASGFSNREIARATSKSEGTVKNQVSTILAKLEARDRTRAVLKAIELGILA